MVAAALLFLVPSVLGQNTAMNFNGQYWGGTLTYGSETVAAGFYGGSINNVPVGLGLSGGPGMVCDDFNDNITSGETWTANGINAANLSATNIGQTLFGANVDQNKALKLYTEVAYLVDQMRTNPTMQAAYSEAIWALTSGVQPTGGLGVDAAAFYTAAVNFASNSSNSLAQFADLWIYTPDPLGYQRQGQQPQAQEMWGWVAVPEGGSALAYLLLAGLSCCGAMFLRSRRQMCAGGSA